MKTIKLSLILALVLCTLMYLLVSFVWGRCPETDCSVNLIDNYLATIKNASVVLGIYFLFFLFLPTHYFAAWFKRIFSWAFPVALLTVIGAEGGKNIMSLSKAETVNLNGIIFGLVTLVFVLYWRRKTKGSNISSK